MAADDEVAAEAVEYGSRSLMAVGFEFGDTVVVVVVEMRRRSGRGRSHMSDMDFGLEYVMTVDRY